MLNKYSCLIKLKVEAGQGSIILLDYTFVNVIVKHWNNTITSNRIIKKILESVENIFLIQFCGSSFAEFFVTGCLIMTSPFWSLLLCSVLIYVDNQFANLSSIHDVVYSKTHTS